MLPHDAAGSMKIQIQILQDLSLPGLHVTVPSLLMVHVDGAYLLPVYENCNVLTRAREEKMCSVCPTHMRRVLSQREAPKSHMSVIPASERS